MRKKTSVILSSCICSILCISILITSLYVTKTNANKPTELNSSVAFVDFENLINTSEFQDEMNINHKKVFGDNYFEILSKNEESTNEAKKIEEMFITQNGDSIYPDYYGGKYINSEGELIIQVTKESNNLKNVSSNVNYNAFVNSIDATKIEYVDYSLNDLEYVNNEIIEYFTNNGASIDGFIGNYVDINTNSVIVELKNNTLEEQNNFKQNVVDSEFITFVKGEVITPTASYKAGALYTTNKTITSNGSQSISIGECTIGYRAKLNGVAGFVTAGHCFGQKGDSAVNLGSATKIVYNQTMDAAFVTTNSGVTITNTLNKTNYLAQSLNTSSAGYITTGTAIGKVGGKSGYQSGTIQSLNYSTTYTDGSYHSNLIKASNYNIKGDSGGPVFKLGTASAPTGTVIGVTAMGYEDGGNLTGFYNADTIATSLGITRY